jgi:predicted RecB family nuclease
LFEAEVVQKLSALHSAMVVIGRGEPATREGATAAAMTQGALLIIGGRLPMDLAGRRVGEPDLLVRAGDERRYRAVDIKHHRCLDETPGAIPALCSALGSPGAEAAVVASDLWARKQRGDLLQLAHYQRMLEATGFAASDGRLAGIVGTEEEVVWHDLDAPIWVTPSSTGHQKRRTTMEIYDFEFDFRLDILAVAAAHRADPTVELLVVPVRVPECDTCPWWSWCGPALHSGAGDVSLVPRSGWRAWRTHRDHGVSDRRQLAGLDYRTATLVANGVDLGTLLAAIGTLPGSTAVEDIIGIRKKAQVVRLKAAGITTLDDARALQPKTASYGDDPLAGLPEQIELARAVLGDAPAYRRRGVEVVKVPRGDIEVDIDMENVEDGVYLWGTLVSTPGHNLAVPCGYRAFVTWDPLNPTNEAAIFVEFWTWLGELRAWAAGRGLPMRAYCYNAGAENTQMCRIATATGLEEDVANFLASEDWVDLLPIFDTQLITGQPVGLKSVARLCGFAWEVDDAGGAESMVRYKAAVDPSDPTSAEAARSWLTTYNQNDVEAMAALRRWLDTKASGFPSVENLGS